MSPLALLIFHGRGKILHVRFFFDKYMSFPSHPAPFVIKTGVQAILRCHNMSQNKYSKLINYTPEGDKSIYFLETLCLLFPKFENGVHRYTQQNFSEPIRQHILLRSSLHLICISFCVHLLRNYV